VGAGRYDGRVAVTFLPDGRRVQLLEAFAFIDEKGDRWDVPKNAIVDGAPSRNRCGASPVAHSRAFIATHRSFMIGIAT
jgi:hypothetical protein